MLDMLSCVVADQTLAEPHWVHDHHSIVHSCELGMWLVSTVATGTGATAYDKDMTLGLEVYHQRSWNLGRTLSQRPRWAQGLLGCGLGAQAAVDHGRQRARLLNLETSFTTSSITIRYGPYHMVADHLQLLAL